MSASVTHLGGEGAPVALVHGFGADRLSWAPTVPALAGSHALHAVELPGHGRAGDVSGSTTVEDLAEAVAEVIAPLGPLPVVGHSLGGAVAVHLAAIRPDLVTRLVLIAPAGWGGPLDASFLRGLARATDVDTVQGFLEQMVVAPRHIPPGLAAHLLDGLGARRDSLEAIADALLTMPAPPEPQLPAVTIWGAEDRINPLDRDRSVPGLHVIEGAGHLPHVEKMSAVNRILAQALA